jgi:hypothetical protein
MSNKATICLLPIIFAVTCYCVGVAQEGGVMPSFLPTLTPESSLTNNQTPAPKRTLTPAPASNQVSGILPSECEKHNIETSFDSWAQFLIKSYGANGCKFTMVSPDGKYLAYVTLIQQKDKAGGLYVDAIKLWKLNSPELLSKIYVAHRMYYIGRLEWSLSNKLMFWESIWEGPGVTFIYDPAPNRILAKMRADQETAWQWNPQHTAFYAVRIGGYGADNCVGELSGYDFTSDTLFPDLRKLFGAEQAADDLFSPHEIANDLLIKPFNWSPDGNRLWLTVTPLIWKGNQVYEYEMGPRQAGVVEMSPTGTRYTSLGADPHFDYSFEGWPYPKIVSQVYQSRLCP